MPIKNIWTREGWQWWYKTPEKSVLAVLAALFLELWGQIPSNLGTKLFILTYCNLDFFNTVVFIKLFKMK